MNVLFGSSSQMLRVLPSDLSSRELVVFGGLLFLMFWLGVTWQTFIF